MSAVLSEPFSELASDGDQVLSDAMETLADLSDTPAEFAARVTAFARLENLRRDLEEALAAVKAAALPLGNQLIEDFAAHNIRRTTAEGLVIFPKSRRYVSKKGDVPTETLLDALRECGWGYLVNEGYSAQSLLGKVNAVLKEGGEVPPQVAELLRIGEVLSMGTQRRD